MALVQQLEGNVLLVTGGPWDDYGQVWTSGGVSVRRDGRIRQLRQYTSSA